MRLPVPGVLLSFALAVQVSGAVSQSVARIVKVEPLAYGQEYATVMNTGTKPITAFVIRNRNSPGYVSSTDLLDASLEPGQTFTTNNAPAGVPKEQLVLDAVIFEDGTTEGTSFDPA